MIYMQVPGGSAGCGIRGAVEHLLVCWLAVGSIGATADVLPKGSKPIRTSHQVGTDVNSQRQFR